MRYEINLQNELTKQGLYFPRAVVPEADRSAPRYWVRYDSGAWESITPERGSQVMRRDDAVRRAILAAEEHDADAVEVADKPLDGAWVRRLVSAGRRRSDASARGARLDGCWMTLAPCGFSAFTSSPLSVGLRIR